jgi:hypothetical protein
MQANNDGGYGHVLKAAPPAAARSREKALGSSPRVHHLQVRMCALHVCVCASHQAAPPRCCGKLLEKRLICTHVNLPYIFVCMYTSIETQIHTNK